MGNAVDYAGTGLDIQAAMLSEVKKTSAKRGPISVVWDGRDIQTSAFMNVPKDGVIKATFLKCDDIVAQGFDLALDGYLELQGGEHVSLLRTWCESQYSDSVTYSFHSDDGIIKFWNVYRRSWPNGKITEEKWTGNAGFWIEEMGAGAYKFHCSPGPIERPDFECLVIEIHIASRQDEL